MAALKEDLLVVLGKAKSDLRSLAMATQARQNVEWATSSVEIEVDDLGPYASACLDVRTKDGIGLSWYLDIRPRTDDWSLSLRTERNDAQGGDTLDSTEMVTPTTRLGSAVDRLIRRVAVNVVSSPVEGVLGPPSQT